MAEYVIIFKFFFQADASKYTGGKKLPLANSLEVWLLSRFIKNRVRTIQGRILC